MSTYTFNNSDEDTKAFRICLAVSMVITLVVFLKLLYTQNNPTETFNVPIYRISTTGAISGSQWRFAGLGAGDINNAVEYFSKDFESLPDGSIRFTTLDGSQVHCTNYKASKFNATFKKKLKYNQVFFIHPRNERWVKVVDPRLLD